MNTYPLKTSFLIAGLLFAAQVMAQDTAEQEIVLGASEAEIIFEEESKLQQKWHEYLNKKGWNSNENGDGVIYIEENGLIISSGSQFTQVAAGQPGWVESRIAAYEQAELIAKAKIAEYLSTTSESERQFEMLENAAWSDGVTHDLKQLNTAKEKLKMLGNKTLDLAEAKLDQAIAQLDPGYDPAKYSNQTTADLQLTYENIFKRKLKSMTTRMLTGVTPVYNVEGIESGRHQVLVGVIWSPKLNRVAMSMFNNEYNVPALQAGKSADQYIPTDANGLIGMYGTRVIVDENGEYALLAFAQAQPRKTSKARQPIAIQDAKSISADRARGLITNYVREGIAAQSSEVSEEVARVYSDQSSGVNIMREYRDRVSSRNDKIKIKGLSPVKQWRSKHPVSGQDIVGTVMLWSPRSLVASEKMVETMTNANQKTSEKDKQEPGAKAAPEPEHLLESLDVDTSAY